MFDFHSSHTYRALRYPFWVVVPAEIIFAMIAGLFLLMYLFPKPHPLPSDLAHGEVLGILLMVVAANMWCLLYLLFYLFYLERLRASLPLADAETLLEKGSDINFADFLDLDASHALHKAMVFAHKRTIGLSAPEVLFALLGHPRADFIFTRLLINKKNFEKSMEVIVNSREQLRPNESPLGNDFFTLMRRALQDALGHSETLIGFSNVFFAAVSTDKTIQRIFFDFGVRREDLFHVVEWENRWHKEYEVGKPFLDQFLQVKGFADDWVYGYTPTLNMYSRPVAVRSVESEVHMHILSREEEINTLETILARSGRNNVVLVGDSGVGKTSVVLGFAQRIQYGTVSFPLKNKRMLELDANLVIAQAHDSASAIALFDKIFSETERAGNIILVLDRIHHIVGPQRREEIGSVDISSVLIPYLQSDTFHLVALTTDEAYHSRLERVPSLPTLLEKVEVRELDEEQTLIVLEDMVPKLERRQRLFISYYALAETVSASGSFIQNIPFPEKAITLLTETLAYALGHKLFGRVVTQDHVAEVVSRKTGIPLGRIEGEEKAKLLNLEGLLHQRIISQNEAITQIASSMRRIRSGITERKRPIGTFLFLGPTGVGKTETAKALAAVYFGSEERMVRLDMTEYQSADSVNRLIGNIDMGTPAQFADRVRSNPFSIVVLDELEKSHPNVQNLFLQVLDEGRLTDAFQKKVSFRNTIIIATSNAGSEFIREYAKNGQDMEMAQGRLVEYLLKNNVFKPEFLNRFDALVVFAPLTPEDVKLIAGLMLNGLRARLEAKGYVLQYDEKALETIAQKGYNTDFGARELRRFIGEAVENKIADKIIKGEYREGNTIVLADLL